MSDKTPENEPRPAAPASSDGAGFSRRQVQWGRMPSQVFRTGPLPKAAPLASQPLASQPLAPVQPARPTPPRPAPAPAVARPAVTGQGGIYSGSLIPRARPDAATGSLPPVVRQSAVPQAAAQPRPVQSSPEHPARQALATPRPAPEPAVNTVAAAPARLWPDTTVRPLPEAAAPAVSSFDPLPEPFAAIPEPVDAPALAVTPALTRATRKPDASRLPLYIGAGVVVVAAVAAAVWFLRPQSPVAPAASTVTEAAPVVAAPVESAPVAAPVGTPVAAPELTPPAVTAPPATPAAAAPARPTTAPVQTRPATAAATRPVAQVPAQAPAQTPATRPAPTPVAPPPQIVVAPIVVAPAAPPPTAARPQTNDPDAPITTRPQPLD